MKKRLLDKEIESTKSLIERYEAKAEMEKAKLKALEEQKDAQDS